MVLGRIVKPKNQRAKRALEKREPKIFENDKTTMFIKGGQTSDLVSQVLKELSILKKPLSNMFHRKNIMRPFDDQTSIEFFSKKTDSSLFVFGSHSKKRPNNLVIGRLFDQHVLDMFEFGIQKFKSMKDFPNEKVTVGTKPCLLFSGEKFESDPVYKRIKNLLIDLFRGAAVTQLRLSGVEHVYEFLAEDETVYLRSYRVLLKKSGCRTPRIELEEIGPSLTLVQRRSKVASDDLYKVANKQPITAKPKKKKNISEDAFGSRLGRIHMTPQDLNKLQVRKLKALKHGPEAKKRKTQDEENGETMTTEEETIHVVTGDKTKSSKGSKPKKLRKTSEENMDVE